MGVNAVLSLEAESERLARLNQREIKSIIRTFIFPPNEGRMRLIHVDRDSLPIGLVVPYNFDAQPGEGIHYPASIAVIAPEDADKLAPPNGWGHWEAANIVTRHSKR